MSSTTKNITSLSPTRPKIVLWGDSLTQTGWEGWVAGLANRYQRRADVINRGMSGYNSKWFSLLQLENEFNENDHVCLLTIWFGANDASLEQYNPHHYVPIEEYKDNLKSLVDKARTKIKSSHIILITPPPVDHQQRLEYQKQRYPQSPSGILERTLENSGKYAQACKEVAESVQIPCLDLWTLFQKEKEWSKFLNDGLHFSKDGHEFVLTKLLELIEVQFPELMITPDPITGQSANSGSKSGSALTQFGPYHDQIDHTNPQKAMDEAFAIIPAATSRSTNGNDDDGHDAKKQKVEL